jgi:Mrp family chromosome partitioning ATPase
MNTRQPKNPAPPPASITLRDVYYVLFRHKWLTAVLVAMGVVGSLVVYENWLYQFPYISEAKLDILYIQDTKVPTPIDGNANVRSPDDRGANILNTELEMLRSLDPAMQVATVLGQEKMEKILGKALPSNSVNNYYALAAVGNQILANLTAEVPLKSDVILLHYKASDPELARQVLFELISAYKSNYVTNHFLMGASEEVLQEQVDKSKNHLQETMNDLEAEKVKLGITSVPDFKKSLTDQLFKTQESVNQVRTEMAETEAIIRDLQAQNPATMTNASATNSMTNVLAVAPSDSPTPDILAKYQNLSANLSAKRAEEERLLSQFSTNTLRVQNAQQQRAAAEAEVQRFEAQNPGLIASKSNVPGSPLGPSADPMAVLRLNETKEHSLQARFKELISQLDVIQTNAIRLDHAEDTITKLETEKEVADAKYKHYLASQEQARIDAANGNKVSNITTVEQPTPGARDGTKMRKATAAVLGAFLALAFGLPFLIEMVLDQSFKLPMDVKARIDAPFFITIPMTNGRHKLADLKRANPAALLTANGATALEAEAGDGLLPPSTRAPLAPCEERRELRPFFEALRDRLMTYFEMINLTHKPKLVAVTSCGEGAGVTTTAAGLAASLSEIGEGNVLLVNMSARDGEAHHFYKGKLGAGIEEVLARGKRDQAQVQDHLYVVKEMGSGDSLPRVLPKRFSHLVPLMKASDYDYIIFDMPPMSEISITPRLARFMDMVLLVIESEKTSHEAGIRAAALLAESKTNVGLVLNKNRSYLPKRLQNT